MSELVDYFFLLLIYLLVLTFDLNNAFPTDYLQ